MFARVKPVPFPIVILLSLAAILIQWWACKRD